MFEAKINSIVQSKEKPEMDQMFLRDARRIQICNVIESLTDEEFLSLQKSILISFDAVQVLNYVVKEGIRTKKSYNDIYNELNDAYLESSESSFYFKNAYIELCNFLVTIHGVLDNQDENEINLLQSFSKLIEEPFDSERNSILQAIFTRNELKSRIIQNTEIKNEKIVTPQQLQNIDSANQLYEQIREMLLKQVQDKDVKEKLKQASPSFIDVALVQPISVLKNQLSLKEETKDHIASILERGKEELSEIHSRSFKAVTSLSTMENIVLYSLSECKNALDQLLELLTAIPGDDFKWEIYFLNQVKKSSDRKQKRFYSGKSFHYPSMKDETHGREKTLSEFASGLVDRLSLYKKQCQENVNKKTACSIDLAFQEMISELPYKHNQIKVDEENVDLSEQPLEVVIQDMISLKEYLDLKERFLQFFQRLLNGECKKEIVDYFGQEESEIDSDKREFMRSIAKFIWSNPMLNYLEDNVDTSQLDLYNELQDARRIQEDEVIDAILNGPVYQKKQS